MRHGESEGNAAFVLQSPDSPLSDTGREQAEKIAGRVSALPFEALLASPHARTKETAEVIAKVTGKAPEFFDAFVERRKPTSVIGKTYGDEEVRETWKKWNKSLHTSGMRVEDGENFDDLFARVDNALTLLQDRPENALVVVTHGFFLRALVARVVFGGALTGDLFYHFRNVMTMENTGLTVLRYRSASEEEDPHWHLWIYNDHAHLAE